jgi:hypothetical protein
MEGVKNLSKSGAYQAALMWQTLESGSWPQSVIQYYEETMR